MRGELATRPIALVGLAIVATVAAVVVSVFLLLRLWNASPGEDRVHLPMDILVPGPRVQSAPQLDMQAYRAAKQRILESAAWVDAQRGTARIPVADAMALLAASAASAPQAAGARP